MAGCADLASERNEALTDFVRWAVHAREKEMSPDGQAYAEGRVSIGRTALEHMAKCVGNSSMVRAPVDILIWLDRNGKAVKVMMLQKTSYSECISTHLRGQSFPKPPHVEKVNGRYPIYLVGDIN